MFVDPTNFRRASSLHSILPNSNPTGDESLVKLKQERVQTWLISKFGETQGNKTFQTYLGNEPRSIKWKHYIPKLPIPEEFKKRDLESAFDAPLENAQKKRKYYLSNFDFTENEQGGFEVSSNLEPLTVNKFLDQTWISKHRERCIQKDGDLLINKSKYALDLHLSMAMKPIIDRSIENKFQGFPLSQSLDYHSSQQKESVIDRDKNIVVEINETETSPKDTIRFIEMSPDLEQESPLSVDEHQGETSALEAVPQILTNDASEKIFDSSLQPSIYEHPIIISEQSVAHSEVEHSNSILLDESKKNHRPEHSIFYTILEKIQAFVRKIFSSFYSIPYLFSRKEPELTQQISRVPQYLEEDSTLLPHEEALRQKIEGEEQLLSNEPKFEVEEPLDVDNQETERVDHIDRDEQKAEDEVKLDATGQKIECKNCLDVDSQNAQDNESSDADSQMTEDEDSFDEFLEFFD
jgi:hypothetical protein